MSEQDKYTEQAVQIIADWDNDPHQLWDGLAERIAAALRSAASDAAKAATERAATLHSALMVFNELTPLHELTYHILEQDKRVCVYYTKDNGDGHYVLWDSLDHPAAIRSAAEPDKGE